MDDFAGSADQIAKQLVAGGMEPDRAMMMALRMAQSRQQADQSILGGVPTQPPVSDVPPATEILGGDPSRLFQRQPTTMERIKDLPKDVLGAGEALVSMGSLAALAPASMMYALRPGQKTQGDPMEFALRNMYMPRSERGPSHLAGLGEVLESLPQTGPLPELQAFTGVGRGVGRQLAEKGRQAGRAMAPAAANVAEDILSRQGLLMGVVKQRDGNWISGDPNQSQNFLLGGVEAGLAQLKSPTIAGETPAQRIPRHEQLLRDPSLNEESRQTVQRMLDQEKQRAAVDNWVQRNLGNYVKKEMATPEDPVRKLMDQGITHLPREEIEAYRTTAVQNLRRKEGFPEEGMAQTALGREWENRADQAIESVSGRQGKGLIDTRIVTAGDIQKAVELMPDLQAAEREFLYVKSSIRPEAKEKFMARGLSENEASLLSAKMPINELAELVGKKEDLDVTEKNYLQLKRNLNAADYSLGVKNPWIQKLDPETKLYGADIRDLGFDHIVDVLRQDLAEGRIRPEQLNKVSMEQAVRRTYEYDQEMARKMREAQIKATEGMPTFKEYPEQGFKWVELTLPQENAKRIAEIDKLLNAERQSGDYGVNWLRSASGEKEYFVTKGTGRNTVYMEKFPTEEQAIVRSKELSGQQIDVDKLRSERNLLTKEARQKSLEDALKYEGETMGHCVGGYCPDVLEGRSRIFSLRDAKGEPHVTVEVQPVKMSQSEAASQARGEGLKGFEFAERVMNLMEGKDVPPNIVQIKGKQNRKPKDEYLPFVQDFVRSGNWSKVGDPQNAGLRRYTDVFNDAEQRKIEALNLPVPNHMWLTGEEIQTLHNAINPEGKRLKYNASGQIVGDSYKQGGSVNHKAVASARRALEKAMAKGGIAKAVGKAAAKATVKTEQRGLDLERLKTTGIEVPEAGFSKEDKAVLRPLYNQGLIRVEERDGKKILVPGKGAWYEFATPEQRTRLDALQESQGVKDLSLMGPTESLLNSAQASFYDFEIVPGVRNVPIQSLEPLLPGYESAQEMKRIQNLANQIKESKQIEPLFIGVDPTGIPYIMEGQHRIRALKSLGYEDVPARIVVDMDDVEKAAGGSVKMAGGGSALGRAAKAGAKAAKAAKSDDEKTLPMVLQRAPAKTKQELQAEAERVGRQIIGEHVTKPGDTANLADYSKKVSERLRAMQEGQDYVLKETTPTSPLANVNPAVGSILVGLPGDISIADKKLMSLGKLKIGSQQQGGSLYGVPFMNDPEELAKFWASNYGPANIFQNKVTELGGLYPDQDILGAYMSMGRTGMNFAQHFADANLKAIRSAIKAGDVSKDDIESFNKMIREGWSKINQKTGEREYFKYPDFAGIEKTGESYAQMMLDPELRKWFNDRMKTGKETAPRGLPSGVDIEYAISEPALRNLEHSLVGYSVGKMQPGKGLISPVDHATYSHGIPGQAIGRLAGHIPARIAFSDASKVIAETKRPQDFTGTIQKVFPHQVVDQQWQDEVGQYLEYLKRFTGKKKGGLMKKSSKLPKVIKSGKVGGLSALRK